MDDPPALPGLETDDLLDRPALVAAVRATFAALDAAGVLEPRHAATMALTLVLAESLGSARVGRGASIALLARELRETLGQLPVPAPAVDDALAAFERDFAAAARYPA